MSKIQEITQQITAQPQVQAGIQWYQALSARDQLIVRGVGLFVALALVFLIVYAPLIKDQRSLEGRLDRAVASYNKIAQNAHKFGGAGTSSGPILSVVTQQARRSGITLSRYEQDGKGLRIWVDKVAFDEAIAWLEELQAKNGIAVSQINIERKDNPGWVDLRATLSP